MLRKTRIVVPPSKGHTPLLLDSRLFDSVEQTSLGRAGSPADSIGVCRPSLTPLSGTREGTFRAMITLAAKNRAFTLPSV